MAHFAEIDSNNKVVQVLVVPDHQQDRGQDFLANDLGLGGTWLQTSYNTHGGQHPEGRPLRKNYAGIGYIYDKERDAFYQPQPYPSWTISAPNWTWESPVPYPSDGGRYLWDEQTLSWKKSE